MRGQVKNVQAIQRKCVAEIINNHLNNLPSVIVVVSRCYQSDVNYGNNRLDQNELQNSSVTKSHKPVDAKNWMQHDDKQFKVFPGGLLSVSRLRSQKTKWKRHPQWRLIFYLIHTIGFSATVFQEKIQKRIHNKGFIHISKGTKEYWDQAKFKSGFNIESYLKISEYRPLFPNDIATAEVIAYTGQISKILTTYAVEIIRSGNNACDSNRFRELTLNLWHAIIREVGNSMKHANPNRHSSRSVSWIVSLRT